MIDTVGERSVRVAHGLDQQRIGAARREPERIGHREHDARPVHEVLGAERRHRRHVQCERRPLALRVGARDRQLVTQPRGSEMCRAAARPHLRRVRDQRARGPERRRAGRRVHLLTTPREAGETNKPNKQGADETRGPETSARSSCAPRVGGNGPEPPRCAPRLRRVHRKIGVSVADVSVARRRLRRQGPLADQFGVITTVR